MERIDVNSAIAGEIMTPFVIMLEIDANFQDLITLMHENRISAVFIHDPSDDKYYIISQTDIVRYLEKGGISKQDLANTPVRELMTGPIELLDFNIPVDKIIRYMAEKRYKRVLISKDGKPTGVVSTRNVMKWNNTYFRPSKAQVLLFMDNYTSNFVAKHIFDKNLDSELEKDLIDLYGGALHAISIITDEVIKKSGKMYHIMKDKRSILFEPYINITGILICDYNSVDLRRKLQQATKLFYEVNRQLLEVAEERKGCFQQCNIKPVISLFEVE